MTLNIPPVAHSSFAIPGSNLYRHESHFVVSSDQVNEHPDSSPVQRSALIHRQVYGSITSITTDILRLLSSDPTKAKQQLEELNTQLKSLCNLS